MVSSDYVFGHLALIGRMLGGDRAANDDMDITAEGYWRSFWAIPWSIPAMLFVWTISARSADHPAQNMTPVMRVLADAISDIGLWIVLVAVFTLVLPKTPFAGRTVAFVVARNWLTLVMNYLLAAAFLPALVAGPDAEFIGWLLLGIFVVLIIAYVRVTALSLKTNVFVGLALVAAEVTVTMMVGTLVYDMLGAV